MFIDANIPVDNEEHFGSVHAMEMCKELSQVGFDGACLSITVHGRVSKDHKRKISLDTKLVKELFHHDPLKLRPSHAAGREFTLKYRLTAIPTEDPHIHSLSAGNSALHQYDILAVRPTTEKIFHQACSSMDIDVISLDAANRLPFTIRIPQAQQAVQRGLFFEVSYSSMVKDHASRRNTIANARALLRATKGRNIIISSDASHPIDIRGPYDVMNIAHVFGVDITSAREFIEGNVRRMMLKSVARRSHRSAAQVVTLGDDKEEISFAGQKRPLE